MRGRSVVFVNRYFHPDHSATSQLLSDLAFDLAQKGFKVTVVTGDQVYDDPAARLPARERIGGVDIVRLRTTRFGRTRLSGRVLDYATFCLAVSWALWRQVRPDDVLVAKTDPPLLSVIAATVARLRGATLVNWLQDLFPEVAIALRIPGARLLSPLLGWLRDRSLRAAACNVAIGDGMARRLGALGIPRTDVRVIHNWSCVSDTSPDRRAVAALRQAWGLGERFVVTYSGNLGRAHDVDTVFEAARLLEAESDIVFLFVGGGAGRRELETSAVRHGLGNVLFKPYQPLIQLADTLAVGDVHLVSLRPELEELIVPSKFYGIIAAGRTVINVGHAEGEVARLIVQSGCGVTVGLGDAAGLASAIRRLALDPWRCRRMGARGRLAYQRRFARRLALDRWAGLLDAQPRVQPVTSYARHMGRE